MRQDNARAAEQLERMKELQRRGLCFFCDENYLAIGAKPAKLSLYKWYVRENDFPYEGALRHYIIAPYRHVRRVTELTTEEWVELLEVMRHLEAIDHHLPGESVFVRSGDMAYTGATLDHLHFHRLVGERKPEPKPLTLLERIRKWWQGKNYFLKNNILVTLGHKAK